MPARKRKKVKKNNIKIPRKVLVLFFIVISLFAAFFLFLTSSAIDSNKYVVAFQGESGDVQVEIYDFSSGEIDVIDIPGDVYVNTAYGFGDWRIGSLGKLGNQEKYGGELLRMSIVKSFHFPVDAWVEGSRLSFNSNSSLSLKQKLQLLWFKLRTPVSKTSETDLKNGGYLQETKLPDGDDGYALVRELPASLGTKFTISWGEKRMPRVGIYNTTGGSGNTIHNLSEVIHILGGDWVIVEKPPTENDCYVKGNNSALKEKLSKLLLCSINDESVEGNFDIEIVVGQKFVERF